MTRSDKTALVTGANSGLGFEAARQLSDDGWGEIILACRSLEKAAAARTKLIELTARDPFKELAIDTSEIASAHAAADSLRGRNVTIDFLLLNAGASSKDASFNAEGVETTYASTLVGHHVLTMRALADGLLAPSARIVIAGSEGARGNMPGMKVHDIEKIAQDEFDGDLVAAIAALTKLQTRAQDTFVNMGEYVTAKLLVAWWAAALARRLPAGMTVNAVSPGAALDTSFARNANAMMKAVMLPMMKLLGPMMGMAGSTESGARRYLDAAELGQDQTGLFFATAHRKKLVGPMGVQTWPAYFANSEGQEASLEALVRLTGAGLPGEPKQTPPHRNRVCVVGTSGARLAGPVRVTVT